MYISIICGLVVALFLFVSIHPCNARQLLDIKRDAQQSFHLPNQEIERSVGIRVLDPSNAHNSESKEFEKGPALNKDFSHETIINPHPTKILTEFIHVHGNSVKASSSSSSSSNVSWKVPHKKKGDEHQQEPGFNLDYSPPKTHPPVHN